MTLVSTSAGLLGIAALQLVSLQSNREAYVRLQASTLTASILDRIRANPRGFLETQYDAIDFNTNGVAGTRAGADVKAWQAEIDRLLPGGTDVAAGAIQRLPQTNTVIVTVRWGAVNRDSATGATIKSLQARTEI